MVRFQSFVLCSHFNDKAALQGCFFFCFFHQAVANPFATECFSYKQFLYFTHFATMVQQVLCMATDKPGTSAPTY